MIALTEITRRTNKNSPKWISYFITFTKVAVASFVISCLAVIVAVGAVWYARGQKRAAEQLAAEAKRSADAAVEMARIEQERRAAETAEADRNRVRFALDRASGW